MNKYEEALKFISKYNPSKEYVDACDTLKEAVEKAEKYDELLEKCLRYETAYENIRDEARALSKENESLKETLRITDASGLSAMIQNIQAERDKYKAIEEEIGCPLEVMLKAIKDRNIYIKEMYNCGAGEVYFLGKLLKKNWQLVYAKDDSLYETDYNTEWCLLFEYDIDGTDQYDWYLIRLSDYKITWWLKEDIGK